MVFTDQPGINAIDAELLHKIRDMLSPGFRIATEQDVADMEQLRAFIRKHGRCGNNTNTAPR